VGSARPWIFTPVAAGNLLQSQSASSGQPDEKAT
jgi:hypothetical protein